jgi:hypothetical protein
MRYILCFVLLFVSVVSQAQVSGVNQQSTSDYWEGRLVIEKELAKHRKIGILGLISPYVSIAGCHPSKTMFTLHFSSVDINSSRSGNSMVVRAGSTFATRNDREIATVVSIRECVGIFSFKTVD